MPGHTLKEMADVEARKRLASFRPIFQQYDLYFISISNSGFYYNGEGLAKCSGCGNEIILENVQLDFDPSADISHLSECKFTCPNTSGNFIEHKRSSAIYLNHININESQENIHTESNEPEKSHRSGPIVEHFEYVARGELKDDDFTDSCSDTENCEDICVDRKGLVLRKGRKRKQVKNVQQIPSKQVSAESSLDQPRTPSAQSRKSRSTTKVSHKKTVSLKRKPLFAEYRHFDVRFETFRLFRHKRLNFNLARAGFFYKGSNGCIRCYHCGLGFKNFDPNDDITAEHARHRPACPVLRTSHDDCASIKDMCDGQSETSRKLLQNHGASRNVQDNTENFHWTLSLEDAKDEFKRVESFQVLACPQHLLHKALYLGQNGFFWTGKDHIIECYECGRRLCVDEEDDVVSNHRDHKPRCPQVLTPPHTNKGLLTNLWYRLTKR